MKLEKLFDNGLLYSPYNEYGDKECYDYAIELISLILKRLENNNKNIIMTPKSLCTMMCYFEDEEIFKRYKRIYVFSRLEDAYHNLDVYGICEKNIRDSYNAPMKRQVYKLIDAINSYVSSYQLSDSDKLEILALQVYSSEARLKLSEVTDLLSWINNILKFLSIRYK